MATVHVTAAPSRVVPQEHHPRRYYPAFGVKPMAVEVTPHIQRLLLNGDLIAVPAEAAAPAAEAAEAAAPAAEAAEATAGGAAQ